MYLLALVSYVYASCIDAPGYPACNDVCTSPDSGASVVCDLEGAGSFDPDTGAQLTVNASSSSGAGYTYLLQEIEGFTSDGVEFCCDAADVGTDPGLYIIGGYDPGYSGLPGLWINTIDMSDEDLDADSEIHGGEGHDLIYGATCTLTDCGWVDTVYGYGGNDEIHLGSGDDIAYGGDGFDHIYGDWGDDTIYTANSAGGSSLWYDYANGGQGTDFLYGGESVPAAYDFLDASDGDDEIAQGYAGDDVLCGAGGRQGLFGGAGDDKLYGGANPDTLSGGLGSHDWCEVDYFNRTGCEHGLSACPAAI